MISKELQLVDNHMHRILIDQCENSEIIEIMNWLLQSKGKQLRSRLAILSSKFSRHPKDVTEYAACIEIIHMASLVHDDVIDNSELRRGNLSVQKKYGKEMAIYSGDYMIFAMISNTVFKPSYRFKNYMKMITNLCMGELSQFNNLHNTDISIEQYLNNIEGKTATLFEAACQIGACEGGCTGKKIKLLSEFGKNLGMIFQVRDDLLDYFSTTEAEGKCTNSDILSGVYTLPLIFTLSKKSEVKELVGNYCKEPTEKNKSVLMQEIQSSGGFEYTYEVIQDYVSKCKDCLNALPNIPQKNELKKILNFVSTLPELKF